MSGLVHKSSFFIDENEHEIKICDFTRKDNVTFLLIWLLHERTIRTNCTLQCFQFHINKSHVQDKLHFKQVAFQSNANHPLAESMGYIQFEEM